MYEALIDKAVQPAGGSAAGGVKDCVYWLGAAPVLMTTNGAADDWDNGEAARNFHRHLDYDAFTASQYNNPANPEKTLPDSLHRTTAPDYFAGYTWPWIDPAAGTHATRVKTLPAKARFDAGRA